MKKINLQMFAYDPNSIVDYLKSTGQDSSYSARKELAQSMGITNYSGTGAQNTQMLNALKNGSGGNSSSGSGPGSSGIPVVVAPSGTKVVESKSDPGSSSNNKTFSQSNGSKKADKKAKEKLEALDQFDVEDIISKETWDALNTPFQSSTAYQDAMNVTNQLREQLTSGKTSYTDQIKALLDEIQNRDKFSYDLSNDTLFQQSLASAMASGKTAMQDTMGQASALTGGYGSTYATSAANQTYNQFIEDAYNNLPEYYQMALQAYEMEGNEMYMELSALSDADMAEYEKMYNAYQANFQNAQTIYQNEYTQWQDKVGNALNSAKLQLEEHGTLYDQAYKTYSAYQQNADTLYAQEFNKWQAETDIDYKYDALAQDQSQYDSDLKLKYDQLAQDNAQHKAELGYKYAALEQDDRQFNATLASKNSSGGGSGSARKASQKELEGAAAAYEEGGDKGLERYLASFGIDLDENIDFFNELRDFAFNYGTYAESPLVERTWKKISYGGSATDGDQVDEDVVEDQYGNRFKLSELPESLQAELRKLRVGNMYRP